jgi:inner membrane protein
MNLLRQHPVVAKLTGILALAVILTLTLRLVTGLLEERARRRDTAVAEITGTWGRSQQITGPFLVVPYRDSSVRLAVILPETLLVDGQLEPVKRHRGIYETVVYTTHLKLSGRFAPPDLAALGVAADGLAWDRAYLALGVDDLRGARSALTVRWDGQSLPLEPGARHPLLPAGVHALLPALSAGAAPAEFFLELDLNGSGRLAFTPVGDQTEVRLRSPWTDPGFTGALLPTRRELGPAGFEAVWQASYYGREYARQWTPDLASPAHDALARSAFGVELVEVVDAYRTVERATKYGLLFFVLIFAAFFLFEVLAALRLHVFHYLLVGAALVLFYLALLSISEFASFGAAYLAAAGASTLLISLYSVSILQGGARSLVIAGALAGVYGFLFFVLRMQDYSLLAGTAALFAVLALVMYLTRKIDWARDAGALPPPLPNN